MVRQGSFGNFSPREDEISSQHFDYLKKALAEKKVVLAGPCLDGEFGIVIFRAASKREAENFMRDDPAVKHGLMTSQLHSFRIAIMEKD